MTMPRTTFAILVLLAAAAGGCERAKSANPLSPDLAGPLPGVEITAPAPLEPEVGKEIIANDQPLTLLIQNAGTTGPRELYLEVDVAADANFQQILHQASRLSQGGNGRTAYRLPEPLGPGHTYYWRARALDGANTGPYSAVAHFAVVEETIIETPTPLEPIGNITTNRPNFVVKNGSTKGPVGDLVYRFEVGNSPAGPAVAVVTVTPGSGGTTSMSLGDLPWDRTLFWRVYATDGVTASPFSSIVSFKTPPAPTAPSPPAPIPSPPPSGGPPLPGGPGGRAPDPPPGQRLPLPNMFHVVRQVADARPDLLRNSCQEHGGSWAFLDLVVDTLRTYDTRWGYNWKRGRVGDPSLDVIDYHWGAGPSEGSTEVYIIDVIAGHCGPNPQPTWGDVTDVTYNNGSVGRWTGRGRF